MKKISQILVIAILLIGLVSSYAQGPNEGHEPSPKKIIKFLDTNDDGKLSKEEASKAKRGKLAENFERIDTNKDGYIDVEELKSANERRKNRDK